MPDDTMDLTRGVFVGVDGAIVWQPLEQPAGLKPGQVAGYPFFRATEHLETDAQDLAEFAAAAMNEYMNTRINGGKQ